MCWTTLWTCKHTIPTRLPRPSSHYRAQNHLRYLQFRPHILSRRTPKLGDRCVHAAFQLTVKISSQKVLPLYRLLRRYHQWPQGHLLFLASYYMCAIPCILFKIDLASFANTPIAHLMTLIIPYQKTSSRTTISHTLLKLIMANCILHLGLFEICPFIF